MYFSPLQDSEIPEDLDFLYIGGGYPEVFIEDLSKNKTMLKSINSALLNGLPCYAECGGLMYLTEGIKTFGEEKIHDTVGLFKGYSYLTKSLQNFGYARIHIEKENPILKVGTAINCHEFHKSKVQVEEPQIYKLEKTTYDNEIKKWNCGYVKENTLGAYGHVHFFNNIDFLEQLMKKAVEYKKSKD
ncbi:Cobyrinate a,c-diamide synthase [bioreactor metagenome]|uniref:Cobyrinate a,c-diamide synthase n=1 Tax=bioreactor metagenome TaxID=1076179 RepID=A0A645CBR9_9ZZZZ